MIWQQGQVAVPRLHGSRGTAPCPPNRGGPAIEKLAAATIRLDEAEREWFGAIRAAHAAGWKVETIAKAADVDEAEVRRIVEQSSRAD